MQLDRLSLENFKCFEKLDMDFGKITLLTGANSSGKSSVFYAILGAIQSGEFPFQFSPNGKFVNMGDYEEMVFQRDKEKQIKLLYEGYDDYHDDIWFTVNSHWIYEDSNVLPVLKSLKIDYNENKIEIDKTNRLVKYWNKDKLLEEITFEDILGVSDESIVDFRDLLIADKLPGILIDIVNEIFVDWDFNFVNASQIPKRTSYEITNENLKVGKYGQGYQDQIIRWQTKESKELEDLLSIMQELKLFQNIKAERLGGGRYELRVQVHKNGPSVALNDVGFGISQFLPIIVADLQLPKNGTLMVAQPEVHLHPSVQAKFGSYLVNQVNTTEKRYIIETHSEYIFNRIRLQIVKGEIDPNDVKMYYLQNDGNGAIAHLLELTKDGQIKNAPKDFFETYLMDTMDIALNAVG